MEQITVVIGDRLGKSCKHGLWLVTRVNKPA